MFSSMKNLTKQLTILKAQSKGRPMVTTYQCMILNKNAIITEETTIFLDPFKILKTSICESKIEASMLRLETIRIEEYVYAGR